MVDENVPAANGRKDVFSLLPQLKRARSCRHKRRVLQFGPVYGPEMSQPAEAQGAAQLVDIVTADLEILDQDIEDSRRHCIVDFDSHNIRETSLPDALFHGFQQVSRLQFLDGSLSIPGYMEGMGFQDFHAREQHLQVGRDQLLQPDQVLSSGTLPVLSFARWSGIHGDQLRNRIRDLDPGKVFGAFTDPEAAQPSSNSGWICGGMAGQDQRPRGSTSGKQSLRNTC